MNYHRRNRPAGRGHDAQARVVRHRTLAAIRDWLGGLVGNESGMVLSPSVMRMMALMLSGSS